METNVALVTAGASGVGRAAAEAYRKAGWSVHVCDIDESAVAAFGGDAQGASATVADVSDPDAASGVIEEVIDRYGRLDVLVNNAGIAGPAAPIEEIDVESWRRTVDVNLNGAFYFARMAAPIMKTARRGAIINIASTAALFGFPLRAAYASSKWAIIGLTKTLAMELGPYGVRVNALCPGSVEGPRIEAVMQREAAARGVSIEEVRRTYEGQISMQKFIRAEDVAEMCVFLSSDAGARISGQSIAIDGHTETLSYPIR
ncbi:SDR family oxidoreductase [Marinicauda salina]|uniref:SDR family oxidoreductase n=1 Tax=Marinicauda salina TaxID=2135793 RepID=UPI001E4653DE|nr:SDR family oxidoreductase [Marinicauda salina]